MKPILVNTKMVQAILGGKKSATRRLIKPQPPSDCQIRQKEEGQFAREWLLYRDDPLLHPDSKSPWGFTFPPPYKVGDVLYVRETWSPLFQTETSEEVVGYMYKADSLEGYDKRHPNGEDYWWTGRWKPSIHMPKAAARLFLRVTTVRAERLQECGNRWCLDIAKEGIITPQDPILYTDDEFHNALREEFRKFWDSTIKQNDLDCYGWEANPWVWVIEFELMKTPKQADCEEGTR